MDYKGYRIVNSEASGGKAGYGCNKQTSLQVRGEGGEFFKYVRYNCEGNLDEIRAKRAKAIEKAKAVVDKRLKEKK